MGWDYTHANYYTDRGEIDRKREIESDLDPSYTVIKSQMVGSTYYGAIKGPKGEVFALVVLTSVNNGDYFNFGQKWMEETMGACYYDCPTSILKLLTPTENEFSNNWRKKCWQKQESKKSLKSLPYGGKIKFTFNGKEYILIKQPPAYQFKSDWWEVLGKNVYFHKKNIPMDFVIIG